MELKEPKSKSYKFRSEPKSTLPLVFGNKGELNKFHANLTALGSCIADPVEIQMIYKMGYFGKGSLSTSHPSFGRIQHGAPPPVTRKRQWKRRQEWINDVQKLSATTFGENNSTSPSSTVTESNNTESNVDLDEQAAAADAPFEAENRVANEIEILDCDAQIPAKKMQQQQLDESMNEQDDACDMVVDYYVVGNNNSSKYKRDDSDLQGKILVLSDSDSETDDYLINIKPEIQHENFPVRETLHLTAEETFFLMYGLGCLRVVDFDGKYLSIGQIWNYFCKEQSRFLPKYIAYHYFRSKGWIVKSGLNYGGDYVLYKEGPPFYHSSYIVMIDVLDAVTCKRIVSKSMRNATWNNSFIGLLRLAETVRKEVLFAQVLWPPSVPVDTLPTSPEILSQFTVKEILVRRWKLYDNNKSASGSDEDSS